MIHWLKRFLVWWCEPELPDIDAQALQHDDFWEIALRAESESTAEPEPGRVDYKFLGMTGEEEA